MTERDIFTEVLEGLHEVQAHTEGKVVLPMHRVDATYRDIQSWVKARYGFVPKTCWIAHCKELAGLPVKRAPNRHGNTRAVPCSNEGKRSAIFAAFRHFGMVENR